MMLEANIVPLQAELGHGAPEFVGGALRRLHRQRGDAHEASRMGCDVLRDLVVLDRSRSRRRARLLIVEIGLRRRGEHVHVDTGRIHVLQAARDVEAAGRERPVGHAADVERRRSSRRRA